MEALSDLGPQMTAEREFPQSARAMVSAVLQAGGAREAVLFTYSDRPSLLSSIASDGFALMPEPAVIPLLPKHFHALQSARGPVILNAGLYDVYLSSNGNVAPELFKCIAPLRVAGKLAGLLALGRREGDALYDDDELDAIGLLSTYVALGVQNHSLSQTLSQRVSENLRLLASLHSFYDNALEAFATAIDVKHVNIHGHSLRVGRYAAAIGDAMGMDPSDVASLRSAGYLHDIGKVAVDRRLFGKTSALDPDEFREMADHTTVGHQIVRSVTFPWPRIPETVRWHHERSDGSGYPDGLTQEEVPMSVRIIGVADSFDAMGSDRPYRKGMCEEKLDAILREGAGKGRMVRQLLTEHMLIGLLVGIGDGDVVRVFNDRGEYLAAVEISDRVPPGIVGGAKGHWPKLNPGGTSIAATVMEKDADMGRGAVFHDNRVEVERAPMSREDFLQAFATLGHGRA